MSYDAAGRLSQTQDGRVRVLAFTYDDLGRKTAMFQDDPAGRKPADWSYDSVVNGVGRLADSTRYEYDAPADLLPRGARIETGDLQPDLRYTDAGSIEAISTTRRTATTTAVVVAPARRTPPT